MLQLSCAVQEQWLQGCMYALQPGRARGGSAWGRAKPCTPTATAAGRAKPRRANRTCRCLHWFFCVLQAQLVAAVEDAGFEAAVSGQREASSTLLRVGGMSCTACAAGVEGVLQAQPGVVQAAVDFLSGRAEVGGGGVEWTGGEGGRRWGVGVLVWECGMVCRWSDRSVRLPAAGSAALSLPHQRS